MAEHRRVRAVGRDVMVSAQVSASAPRCSRSRAGATLPLMLKAALQRPRSARCGSPQRTATVFRAATPWHGFLLRLLAYLGPGSRHRPRGRHGPRVISARIRKRRAGRRSRRGLVAERVPRCGGRVSGAIRPRSGMSCDVRFGYQVARGCRPCAPVRRLFLRPTRRPQPTAPLHGNTTGSGRSRRDRAASRVNRRATRAAARARVQRRLRPWR